MKWFFTAPRCQNDQNDLEGAQALAQKSVQIGIVCVWSKQTVLHGQTS